MLPSLISEAAICTQYLKYARSKGGREGANAICNVAALFFLFTHGTICLVYFCGLHLSDMQTKMKGWAKHKKKTKTFLRWRNWFGRDLVCRNKKSAMLQKKQNHNYDALFR